MTKTYLVVSNGVSKKTGKKYSIAQRVCQKYDKSSEWLDSKDQYFTDDIRPVGTLVEVEQMEV